MPAFASLPLWVPRLVAGLVVAVLTLTLISLIMLMPAIPRLAKASDSLPAATSIVDGAPSTLEQVERIDGNVALVTPPVIKAVEQLPEMTSQLEALLLQADRLHRDVGGLQESVGPLNASAAELVAVGKQVEELRSSLTQLLTFGRPIKQLAASTGPLLEQLRQLNESAATLASLATVIAPLVASIESMEKHVENLDRKTGPVLFPGLGD